MYCRFYELTDEPGSEFVFQAQKLQPETKQYSAIYDYSYESSVFPVRESLEEAIEDLKQKGVDGKVGRFVKTKGVEIGDEKVLSFTAGTAARLWLDTSATEHDKTHPTKEELEAKGCVVSELYFGPFELSQSYKIVSELQDKIPNLRVIKLGSAYNVAQVFSITDTGSAVFKNGKLHFDSSKSQFNQLIEDWHTKDVTSGTDLHDYLNLSQEALAVYANCPGKCVFQASK